MNEAQLPEVTNVPNDLCMARVALFLPGYDSLGGQWWRWCKPRGCFRQPACRHWLMGYVRPPPLIFNSFLLTPALSRQCRGSYHPLRVLSLGMGDARRNPPSLHTSFLLPWGKWEKERERVKERERGEGQSKSFRRGEGTYTSPCFHLSAWWSMIPTTRLRKERTLFEATFLAMMEINCSHKTLSNLTLVTPELRDDSRYSHHSHMPEKTWIWSHEKEKERLWKMRKASCKF